MHGVFPTAVSFAPGGALNAETFQVNGGPTFSHWFAKPEDMLEAQSDTVVWLERRRKDFSDVCHAKLVAECSDLFGVKVLPAIVLDGVTRRLITSHIECSEYSTGGGRSSCTCHVGISSGQANILAEFVADYDRGRSLGRVSFDYSYSRCVRWLSRGRARVAYFKGTNGLTYDQSRDVVTSTTKRGDIDLIAALTEWARAFFKHDPDISESFLLPKAKELRNHIWPVISNYYRDNSGHIFLHASETNGDNAISTSDATRFELGEDIFLLHEPDVIMRHFSDMMLGRGFEHYNRGVLTENSYLDALRSVPKLNDNSVSNILEITGFIKKLVVDHRVDVPESLSDAWLSYRYSYGTGKMDAEEAIHFVHRHMDLGDWTHLKTHGVYRKEISEGITAVCRTVLDIKPKNLPTLQRVWRALYTYGLTPSFYMIWDMIPYSFVVDWFLPIGQVAAAWDAEREYKQQYDMENFIQSITYYRPTDYGSVKCYTRWYASPPERFHGYYFLESSASGKTILKRVLDGVSLIVG
jgi:hypothetical protein